MTDQSESPTSQPAAGSAAHPASGDQSGSAAGAWHPPGGSSPAALVEQRPEIAVGAAFAGGFILAAILKRLAAR